MISHLPMHIVSLAFVTFCQSESSEIVTALQLFKEKETYDVALLSRIGSHCVRSRITSLISGEIYVRKVTHADCSTHENFITRVALLIRFALLLLPWDTRGLRMPSFRCLIAHLLLINNY